MARKLTRSQVRPMALRMLADQGGNCALCGKPIDSRVKGELVLDHDHTTGRVRGALHRSCNAAEGKLLRVASTWGAKGVQEDIIPFVERVLDWWKTEPASDFIYPTHQTEDEKRLARNARARKQRATKRASRNIRERRD